MSEQVKFVIYSGRNKDQDYYQKKNKKPYPKPDKSTPPLINPGKPERIPCRDSDRWHTAEKLRIKPSKYHKYIRGEKREAESLCISGDNKFL